MKLHGKNVRLQVLISPELYAKLEQRAKRERRRVSQMASVLIEDGLNKESKS